MGTQFDLSDFGGYKNSGQPSEISEWSKERNVFFNDIKAVVVPRSKGKGGSKIVPLSSDRDTVHASKEAIKGIGDQLSELGSNPHKIRKLSKRIERLKQAEALLGNDNVIRVIDDKQKAAAAKAWLLFHLSNAQGSPENAPHIPDAELLETVPEFVNEPWIKQLKAAIHDNPDEPTINKIKDILAQLKHSDADVHAWYNRLDEWKSRSPNGIQGIRFVTKDDELVNKYISDLNKATILVQQARTGEHDEHMLFEGSESTSSTEEKGKIKAKRDKSTTLDPQIRSNREKSERSGERYSKGSAVEIERKIHEGQVSEQNKMAERQKRGKERTRLERDQEDAKKMDFLKNLEEHQKRIEIRKQSKE